MNEIWKVCNKSQDYIISNYGNLKNIKTNKNLNSGINTEGYKRANLRINGVNKACNIHRMLMLTFKPEEYFDGAVVNHKDGNKLNNSLDNLEWCTIQENNIHAYKNGLINYEKLSNSKIGEKNHRSKLKENDILEIRRLYSTGQYIHKDLANMYNVSRNQITRIINKKDWTHI